MNYVFFGTPEFAAIILEKLINVGLLPQAIVCNPDKPVGRKKIVTPPPTKLVIRNQKIEDRIKILQPEDLDFKFQILNSKFDFFIVAAYAKILPKGILNIPRLGTIGVHPSLLPKYRGPTPIQTAILNGDEETGASLFLLDEEIDHGKIISNEKLEMRNEDYKILSKKLAGLGAELLIKTLPDFMAGKITP
ncbi:methionyl-tRNA formyltransferase, partial [Candidatus Wolfebacteria bacterium CG03_land_8_20_14_0_80_40_12]